MDLQQLETHFFPALHRVTAETWQCFDFDFIFALLSLSEVTCFLGRATASSLCFFVCWLCESSQVKSQLKHDNVLILTSPLHLLHSIKAHPMKCLTQVGSWNMIWYRLHWCCIIIIIRSNVFWEEQLHRLFVCFYCVNQVHCVCCIALIIAPVITSRAPVGVNNFPPVSASLSFTSSQFLKYHWAPDTCWFAEHFDWFLSRRMDHLSTSQHLGNTINIMTMVVMRMTATTTTITK